MTRAPYRTRALALTPKGLAVTEPQQAPAPHTGESIEAMGSTELRDLLTGLTHRQLVSVMFFLAGYCPADVAEALNSVVTP